MKAASRVAIAVLAIAVLAIGSAAFAATYSNAAPISIPDGNASPYPSSIAVSGANGTVMDVNASLKGFSHTYPADVHVLLVGPTGANVNLMSNAGSGFGVSGVNLTFDDAAATPVPTPITSGTYKPTQASTGCNVPPNFPPPAPPPAYGSALSVFNGTDANGTWNLFVRDTCGFDVGSISGGWMLDIRSCILPEVVAITDPTPAGPVVSALLCT